MTAWTGVLLCLTVRLAFKSDDIDATKLNKLTLAHAGRASEDFEVQLYIQLMLVDSFEPTNPAWCALFSRSCVFYLFFLSGT